MAISIAGRWTTDRHWLAAMRWRRFLNGATGPVKCFGADRDDAGHLVDRATIVDGEWRMECGASVMRCHTGMALARD